MQSFSQINFIKVIFNSERIFVFTVKIKFKILDHYQRPISATADSREVRDVVDVEVYQEKNILFEILFDQNHSLEERIIREQFLV